MPVRSFSSRVLAAVIACVALILLNSHSGGVQPAYGAANASIYWGAYIDLGNGNPVWGDLNDPNNGVSVFEGDAGKKTSILHYGLAWKTSSGAFQRFPTTVMSNIRAHGSIPMINWGSWQLGLGVTQPAFQNAVVAGGAYDDYIRQWAIDAKNWGHPFFMRFDHEMNGWWYPWAEGQTSVGGPIVNGNHPGDYVKMWQHVRGIFLEVGATNVTWVWCPNYAGTGGPAAPLAQVYPGNSEVDWSGLDVYNASSSGWISFNSALTGSGTNWLGNSYQEVLQVAPSKPMMLAEFASIEDVNGDSQRKANWITDALLNQIPDNFPAIKALVWFNWNDNNAANTYLIESSSFAQNAFKTAIASSVYAANDFGSITDSPIQPLVPAPSMDVKLPVTSISQPSTGSAVSGSVIVSATATDDIGVSKVELFKNSFLFAVLESPPFDFVWDTSQEAGGVFSLITKAYDASGNIGASRPVLVNANADMTQPIVAITSPSNGSVVTRAKKLTLSATATDNLAVTRVEFYVNNSLTCTDTAAPYSCTWSIPGKSNATYYLVAKAYDSAGNAGTSATITVTSSR